MKRRVLVIDGHSKKDSFCNALATSYMTKNRGDYEIKYTALSAMHFNPDLTNGYDKQQPLESDLVAFQESLQWAEHIVLFIPVWWGGLPAKFKGLIDRTFLPGFAFQYHANKTIPEQLLKGRTAQLILTLDTPPWYYRVFQGAPVVKQLKHTILGFSGIKLSSTTYIGPIINSNAKQRAKWLTQVSE